MGKRVDSEAALSQPGRRSIRGSFASREEALEALRAWVREERAAWSRTRPDEPFARALAKAGLRPQLVSRFVRQGKPIGRESARVLLEAFGLDARDCEGLLRHLRPRPGRASSRPRSEGRREPEAVRRDLRTVAVEWFCTQALAGISRHMRDLGIYDVHGVQQPDGTVRWEVATRRHFEVVHERPRSEGRRLGARRLC